MGDYLDGQQKGSKTNQVIVSQNIDIEALADALAKKMPTNTRYIGQVGADGGIDDFDNEASMQKLADNMIIQRGDNESNFEELGTVKKTKKDKKDVDSTIDILKNLD